MGIRDTLEPVKAMVQATTPVRSGRLRAGWETNRVDTVYNEVPYSDFVEAGTKRMRGRFMLRDSLEAIAQRAEENVSRRIDRL